MVADAFGFEGGLGACSYSVWFNAIIFNRAWELERVTHSLIK